MGTFGTRQFAPQVIASIAGSDNLAKLVLRFKIPSNPGLRKFSACYILQVPRVTPQALIG
jgi:hypothetical protein